MCVRCRKLHSVILRGIFARGLGNPIWFHCQSLERATERLRPDNWQRLANGGH